MIPQVTKVGSLIELPLEICKYAHSSYLYIWLLRVAVYLVINLLRKVLQYEQNKQYT